MWYLVAVVFGIFIGVVGTVSYVVLTTNEALESDFDTHKNTEKKPKRQYEPRNQHSPDPQDEPNIPMQQYNDLMK